MRFIISLVLDIQLRADSEHSFELQHKRLNMKKTNSFVLLSSKNIFLTNNEKNSNNNSDDDDDDDDDDVELILLCS